MVNRQLSIKLANENHSITFIVQYTERFWYKIVKYRKQLKKKWISLSCLSGSNFFLQHQRSTGDGVIGSTILKLIDNHPLFGGDMPLTH